MYKKEHVYKVIILKMYLCILLGVLNNFISRGWRHLRLSLLCTYHDGVVSGWICPVRGRHEAVRTKYDIRLEHKQFMYEWQLRL